MNHPQEKVLALLAPIQNVVLKGLVSEHAFIMYFAITECHIPINFFQPSFNLSSSS
jgi:hypothetical protein